MASAPTPALCSRCRHHFVTYEPALPHGCRLFGMRSRAMPCHIVREETGRDCQGFEERPAPPRKA